MGIFLRRLNVPGLPAGSPLDDDLGRFLVGLVFILISFSFGLIGSV